MEKETGVASRAISISGTGNLIHSPRRKGKLDDSWTLCKVTSSVAYRMSYHSNAYGKFLAKSASIASLTIYRNTMYNRMRLFLSVVLTNVRSYGFSSIALAPPLLSVAHRSIIIGGLQAKAVTIACSCLYNGMRCATNRAPEMKLVGMWCEAISFHGCLCSFNCICTSLRGI